LFGSAIHLAHRRLPESLEESRDVDELDDDGADGVREGVGSGARLTLGALMGAREEGSERTAGGGEYAGGAERAGGAMLGADEL
jgi:hypothetical protein